MNRIFFQIRRAHYAALEVQKLWLEENDGGEVTPAQLNMLRTIWERGSVMHWHLVDVLGVQRAAITRMVKRLEKKGLVRRSPWKVDERYTELRLTDDGEELMRWIMESACAPRNAELVDSFVGDAKRLDAMLLHARQTLGDRAKLVEPWLRVLLNEGYTLRNPPPPEAVHPPRER